MVGLEVTPTTASSSIIRASLPLCSICRERKSIQTLWPSAESLCRLESGIGHRPFKVFDLLESSHVARTAVEAGGEERRQEVAREGRPDDFRAEAEHVHVIVLHALVRGVDVVADGRANPRELAGRHRSAHAGPADEDAELGVPALDRLPDFPGLHGIVDPRCIRVGAQVHHGVPVEDLQDHVAKMDASMIECNRHLHTWTVPHGRQSTPPASYNGSVDADQLRELGQQLRVDSIRPAAVAKSGHPTSGMSAADLMAVLVANHFRYEFDNPKRATNDRLVFSKGHASTLYYAILRAVGAISDEELLTYRKFGSMLEGHPTPLIPWVDVATGSLGQGLPIGVGLGLAAKYLDRLPTRVWVLCGDSEMAEGSMWEAFEHASHYELDNLIAIIDLNRLGQRGETMVGWNAGVQVERARAFGWNAIEVDGHDVEEIDRAYREAAEVKGRPTVIVARTIKGKGVKAVEDKNGWHGKPLDNPDEAIAELGGVLNIHV